MSKQNIEDIKDFLLSTHEVMKEKQFALRLMKDGHIWDYSTHPQDIIDWWYKILREEPEARLEAEYTTREEMLSWKNHG